MLVEMLGVAGSGKTTLARELARVLRGHDLPALTIREAELIDAVRHLPLLPEGMAHVVPAESGRAVGILNRLAGRRTRNASRYFARHPGLLHEILDRISDARGETTPTALGLCWELAARLESAEVDGPGRTVTVADEGFAQQLVAMHCRPDGPELTPRSAEQLLKLATPTDLLIVVDSRPETVTRRLRRRSAAHRWLDDGRMRCARSAIRSIVEAADALAVDVEVVAPEDSTQEATTKLVPVIISRHGH